MSPEHVAPHDRRADPRLRFLNYLRAFIDLSTPKSMLRTPLGERNHPLVETLAADPERTLRALIGPRDEAVQGDGYPEPQLGHDLSPRDIWPRVRPSGLERPLQR